MQKNPLKKMVQKGVFALTGSEPFVLQTCMQYAKEHNAHFLCEATVNQVNQFGGYTGMKPKDYVNMVCEIAKRIDYPMDHIILSGDHLGPFIWQNLPAEEAMNRSKELVR
jgi:D-tagatose-1,6-bisphosphate aldolase subunit GatZ/KbaZ